MTADRQKERERLSQAKFLKWASQEFQATDLLPVYWHTPYSRTNIAVHCALVPNVKVEDVRIVPEPDEHGEDGLLTWKLRVEPGESREIVTEYVIEYPSHLTAGDLGLEE